MCLLFFVYSDRKHREFMYQGLSMNTIITQ